MFLAHQVSRVVLSFKYLDFRKGIDGMVAVCRTFLQSNPRDGTAFVFRNRSGTGIKILYYDGTGYWCCQKRFSAGKLKHWPKNDSEAQTMPLSLKELIVVIHDGDLARTNFKEEFSVVA